MANQSILTLSIQSPRGRPRKDIPSVLIQLRTALTVVNFRPQAVSQLRHLRRRIALMSVCCGIPISRARCVGR